MLEAPTILYGRDTGSSYQQQEEALGKHFLRSRKDAPRSRRRSGRDQLALPVRPD